MRLYKRSALTLLEVLIALGLFSVLLFVIIGSFQQISLVANKNSECRKEVLERVRFHETFSKAISTSESASFSLVEKEGYLSDVLEFSFQNGPEFNADFSGKIEGAIYLSQERKLILELYSADRSVKPRRLEFFKEVEDLFFELDFSPAIEIKVRRQQKEDLSFVFIRPKLEIMENLGREDIEGEKAQ